MSDKLYIIIPAYNEEANIEKVVKEWYPIIERYGKNSRMVVVDDGSNDSTYNKLQSLSKDRPLLIPLHKLNGGHGTAVLEGYRFALRGGQTIYFKLIQMDRLRRMNSQLFGKYAKSGIW